MSCSARLHSLLSRSQNLGHDRNYNHPIFGERLCLIADASTISDRNVVMLEESMTAMRVNDN